MILNLGCGHTYIEGAVNLDISPNSRADVLHDLSSMPWPFPDNHFAEVRANDIIEHLDDTVAVMEELHRICMPDAKVIVTVPHFSCANAFLDPTHRRYFSARTFHLFEPENGKTFFTKAKFRVLKNEIAFKPTRLNRFVKAWANAHVEWYEERFCWMFPAWFILFELQAVK
jgi:ubiquinone/menaquinone biosynthesis C-methylase UbiE